MTKTLSPLRACLLAACGLSLSTLVSAQIPTLRETRVTATRFVEPAASLPLGVTVITDEEIRASGATSVPDAIIRLLGVAARQDLFNGGDATLDLRGFGTNADQNQVVVVDGIRLSEADLSAPRLAAIPIESIERIEVLRGSGAVLYGEGATGGVIVITTKAASGRQQESAVTLYGAAGSDGLRELRAGGTLASASGFTLDGYAQKRKTDGFRENAASKTEAGSIGGQWSNGWLRLGARAAQDRLNARLPGSLTAAEYADDPSQSTTPDDWVSIRNERASAFAQADLGDWEVVLDAGLRQKKLRSFNFGFFPFDYDVEAQSYSLRARQETKLGKVANILVLGVDRDTWDRTDVTNSSDASQSATGIFAKDDMILAAGTRISLGARTQRLHKEGSGQRLSGREHAWELGISQQFSQDWTVYARTGRSFRLPNADELAFKRPSEMLRPQHSRDGEVGVRWNGSGAALDARVYRSSLTDEIGLDPNGIAPRVAANVNFDRTRREGVELDWSQSLTSALSLRVNAALRRAVFRTGPYAGKDVPLVPRQSLAVRADWVPVVGHRLNAGVNWVSSQHPDFDNACRIPSYATADARYAWSIRPDTELAFAVTNLFDHRYYTQAFGCSGSTTTAIYPEPGRQFTASLRVQF